MGQRANSNRKANLDEKKERMAGRPERGPAREAIKDFQKPLPAKGATGGAHGKDDVANRKGGALHVGGGTGVRAGQSPAKASHLNVGTKRK